MALKKYLILVTLLLVLAGGHISGQHEFRGSIVDSKTGLPLVATVSLINEGGDILKPDGQHDHVFYLGKKRWYVKGEFNITIPGDILHIEIRRGLETLPLVETIDLSGETKHIREFRLHRWVDMRAKGYMSGDSHIHYLKPQDVHLQMQAEDLQVANLLTSDFTDDVEIFTGGVDKVSTINNFVYVGQEIRDWQLGHSNLLESKHIVQPLEPYGGSLAARGSNPNLLLSPRLEESHQQGAINVWAHFSNLPGLESAIAFPLGLIDAVELMTYDDPTMLPSHWTPWDYSNLTVVEFPPMRGMDLYYQYLNAGLKLPITAGTDKMGDNIPVGSNRNYVRIQGDKNYESWVEGMKKGRGFITNGPLITFTADDHRSGEIIHFTGDRTVRVSLKVESLLPFGRLEIVANGKTFAWKYLEDYGRKREIYSAELEVEIPISESTWIAGRVTSLDTPQMLPRNLTVFAHSNPVYFLHEKKAVHVKESVEYLLDYLNSSRNWISNYAKFASENEKGQAMKYLEKAEKALSELGKSTISGSDEIPYSKITYTYKSINNLEIQADVYRSPGEEVRPAIIWIHGGALIFGSRNSIHREQLELYLESGYVVISIDYRLAPETKLAAIIEDLEDAYEWVYKEGPGLYNIFPDRIAVIGHSAGGYLTLMAGVRLKPRPRALVSFYGYGNITGSWYSQPDSFYNERAPILQAQALEFIGESEVSNPAGPGWPNGRVKFYLYCRQQGIWPKEVSGHDPMKDIEWFAAYEPLQNISPAYPPTLLLHGKQDTDVPFEQSVMMAKAFEKHGVEHEFISNPKWRHGFDSAGIKDSTVQNSFCHVLTFLEKYLMK